MVQMVNPTFWKNKKVFLTGHTGFKGSWMSLWLQKMGAQVCGYALQPPTTPSLFEMADVAKGMKSIIGDVNDVSLLQKSMQEFAPEIIIHMAAQPLVRYSYQNPVETFQTNVMGTVQVFESARLLSSVKVILNVTTDKCYENREWNWGYRENEALGGYDPYSSSKACSELVTASYRQSFFEKQKVSLGSARAGNVIGGGDWALDRLIPDLIRSLLVNEQLVIRNPNAIRPWQHVLEPLAGYLMLSEKMYLNPQKFCEAYNFGPQDSDVENVETIVKKVLSRWIPNKGHRVENADLHEAHYLKLDCSKAHSQLGWKPQLTLNESLDLLVDWYQIALVKKENVKQLTLNQIDFYQRKSSQGKN